MQGKPILTGCKAQNYSIKPIFESPKLLRICNLLSVALPEIIIKWQTAQHEQHTR